MTQLSRPSPDNGYAMTTSEYELMARHYAQDGLLGLPTDTAVVYADSTGRQVKIRAGKYAMVQGRLWESDPATDEIVSGLPANASGNPRIDRLVLRLDRSTGNVRTQYLQGTAAASPVAPALTQSTSTSSGQWDFPLAQWNVANGYVTVAATDLNVEGWWINPNGGSLLCRSGWRPFGAALRAGQKVYETSTGLSYSYNGTKWLRDPVSIYKTANTNYVSTITLATDPDLQFAGEANALYEFQFDVGWVAAVSVGGFYNHAIWFPAGVTCQYSRTTYDGAGAVFIDWVNSATAVADYATASGSTRSGGWGMSRFAGTVQFGSTAGTFTWRASQQVSKTTASTTALGSTLRYRQVA